MLHASGVITAEQLHCALRAQRRTKQRLGDILATEYGVAEERITAAVAAQWNLPVLSRGGRPDRGVETICPIRLLDAAGCLPTAYDKGKLLLLTAEAADAGLALALERMHDLQVEFGVTSSSSMRQLREQMCASSIPAETRQCADRSAIAVHAADLLLRLQPVDSRAVRVGRWWWLRLWLEPKTERHTPGDTQDTMDMLYTLQTTEKQTPERIAVKPF